MCIFRSAQRNTQEKTASRTIPAPEKKLFSATADYLLWQKKKKKKSSFLFERNENKIEIF